MRKFFKQQMILTFVVLAGFIIVPSLYAFSAGSKFPAESTTYVIDANYNSSGTKWSEKARFAESQWETKAGFIYTENSSSVNHIQAYPNVATESGCQISGGGKCLAYTQIFASGGTINNFNLRVNTGSGFSFFDGSQNGGILPSNYYDLTSVLYHEFGHALGLCHSGTSGLLMYKSIPPGTYRFIDTDAKNGENFLYNGTQPGPEAGCFF